MEVKNKYKVKATQWKKWSDMSKKVFNDVYDRTRQEQWAIIPAKMALIPEQQWDIIAWNCAFLAADILTQRYVELLTKT